MFKPENYFTGDSFQLGITNCVSMSSYCESSTWLNSCSNCKSNYAYVYDGQNYEINYSTCIVVPDSNCYAFDEDNSECVYCKKGFSFNLDMKCEVINAAKCSFGKMTFDIEFKFKVGKEQFLLAYYMAPTGAGCQQCLDNKVSIFVSDVQYVCTASEYVKAKIFAQDSVFDDKCVNYKVSGDTTLCAVCQENFIPSQNGKCYPQINSQNCLLLKNEVECALCSPQYISIQGNCEFKNLEDCEEYDETDESLTS